MTTATAPSQIPQGTARQQTPQVPALHGPRLPFHPLVEERFGIDRASWKALVEAIFPNAQTVESVVLALSYCKARKLDPFKRNVHIVPIWNKDARCLIDTIWPGIGELRTTAFRTGEYAGRGATVYGPDLTQVVGKVEVTFPEWAQVTVYRMVKGQRVEFCGPRVYWLETYAVKKRDDDSPNEMWETRPRGQIEKCAEAAALRAGFPEEIGSDYIPEEVQHEKTRVVDSTSKPSQTLEDLTARLETDQAPQLQSSEEATDDNGLKPGESMSKDGEITEPHSEDASQVEPDYLAVVSDMKKELAEAKDLAAVQRIEDFYLPKVPADKSIEVHGPCDEKREGIRASRGSKSNQKTMAGAT